MRLMDEPTARAAGGTAAPSLPGLEPRAASPRGGPGRSRLRDRRGRADRGADARRAGRTRAARDERGLVGQLPGRGRGRGRDRLRRARLPRLLTHRPRGRRRAQDLATGALRRARCPGSPGAAAPGGVRAALPPPDARGVPGRSVRPRGAGSARPGQPGPPVSAVRRHCGGLHRDRGATPRRVLRPVSALLRAGLWGSG